MFFYVWEDVSIWACWHHFFHMHLAIWGQSCFLYCSHIKSLPSVRDGECGKWPPLISPQLLSAYWGGGSWWHPNIWLCFTWAHKFAFGKGLFTSRVKSRKYFISHHHFPLSPRTAPYYCLTMTVYFPGASILKNTPAKQETQVWPLGQEDTLEEEMVTHSSILPGNPMARGASLPTVHEVTKSQTRLSN